MHVRLDFSPFRPGTGILGELVSRIDRIGPAVSHTQLDHSLPAVLLVVQTTVLSRVSVKLNDSARLSVLCVFAATLRCSLLARDMRASK